MSAITGCCSRSRIAQSRWSFAMNAAWDTFSMCSMARRMIGSDDYIKTERARKGHAHYSESMTLAWWVHMTARAALHDAELDEVGDWLLVDANPSRAAANLRQFIETEKGDLARRAKRRSKGQPKLRAVEAA